MHCAELPDKLDMIHSTEIMHGLARSLLAGRRLRAIPRHEVNLELRIAIAAFKMHLSYLR